MRVFTQQLNIVVRPEMFQTVLRMSQETGMSQGAIVRKAIELMNAQISHQDKAA